MSDQPENQTPAVDPFIEFWEAHEVHSKNFPPEVAAEFRAFAVNVWNAARYDIGLRYSDLLTGVLTPSDGETLHDAAKRMSATQTRRKGMLATSTKPQTSSTLD